MPQSESRFKGGIQAESRKVRNSFKGLGPEQIYWSQRLQFKVESTRSVRNLPSKLHALRALVAYSRPFRGCIVRSAASTCCPGISESHRAPKSISPAPDLLPTTLRERLPTLLIPLPARSAAQPDPQPSLFQLPASLRNYSDKPITSFQGNQGSPHPLFYYKAHPPQLLLAHSVPACNPNVALWDRPCSFLGCMFG